MEWQLSRSFSKHSDGYDGYQFTGYMDGYTGDPDYDLERFSTLSISDVYDLRRIFAEKYDYYSAIEEPDERILRRVDRALEMRTKCDELVTCIEELDGY